MSLETWQIAEIFSRESRINDFDFTISDQRYPFFIRHESDKIQQFGGGDIFNKKIKGLSCYVTFTDFEKLSLDNTSKDENLTDLISVRPYTHSVLLDFKFGLNIFENFPIEMNHESQVKSIVKLMERFYYQDAKPFFDYWQDIRMFLPFVEEDNENAIELLGNNYILRKMTLWKLCNHPRYERFVKQRVSILENVLNDDPTNEDYLNVLNEIRIKYEVLKVVAPTYEWNSDYLNIKPFKPTQA